MWARDYEVSCLTLFRSEEGGRGGGGGGILPAATLDVNNFFLNIKTNATKLGDFT